MDQIAFQVLLRYNPWLLDKRAWAKTVKRCLPEEFVQRHLATPLKGVPNKVSMVVGPRQSGKSTLIWHYLEKQSTPFLFVNCEEPSLREFCSSPALFLQDIEEIASPFPGLFLEEIQHLPDAGLFLKGLVDQKPDVPIFATGSASYHLRSKTRESLAGRAIRHILLPFGMAEMWPSELPPLIAEEKARELWRDLLLWGGYPEVVLNRNKEEILSQLVESFVLRDASDLHRIKRPEAFRRLLSLAASQIGNLVNFSGWAENLGVSVNTAIEYVNIMEESHLVKLVTPFVGGKRAEITSTPKMFFLDNGLRNFLFGGFTAVNQRADYGALIENLVFAELARQTHPLLDTISFWRSSSGAEVDFVVRKKDQLIAIEVKAAGLKRPKMSRSLRSFVQAYHPDKVFILNESLVDVLELEGRPVYFDKLIHAHTILKE